MFAIDTTGSMSSYIQAARDTARSAAASIFASAKQGRVGLVEYRDHGDAFVARTVIPLTTSADDFSAGLDGLTPEGGGDWPEALISGVYESARAEWNPVASKSVIVIADAPAHDPEPVTGYTLAQMSEVLAGRAPVPAAPTSGARMFSSPDDRAQAPSPVGTATAPPVARSNARSGTAVTAAEAPPVAGGGITLYGISANSTLTDQLQSVAAASGGRVSGIDDPAQVQELILDAIDDATAAPEAALAASQPQITDVPVAFSAGDSTAEGAVVTYDFDLDGDGVFERSGTAPAVEATYTDPGERTASVRVTDERGRTAVASVPINVLAKEETVITPVDPTEASTTLQQVTLSSAETSAAVPATVRIADPLLVNETVGARLVPAGSPDPWTESPAAAYEAKPAPDNSVAASLVPPTGLAQGTYDVLVFSDAGRHALLQVEVVGDEPQIVPVPATPAVADPAGPGNATWIVPAADGTFSWAVAEDGSLRVEIVAASTTFPDGSTTHNYGVAPDSTPDLFVVVPEAPVRSGNVITVPAQTGVIYKDARNKTVTGTVSVPRKGVSLTASPATGYSFAPGSQTTWTYAYESKPKPQTPWWRLILEWLLRRV
jgi:hypothetical protein